MNKSDKVLKIMDEFNKSSTEVDMAFYIFANSINELESLRKSLKTSSNFIELEKKLNEIQDMLLLAETKFTASRMYTGKTIISRYLTLIKQIKKC